MASRSIPDVSLREISDATGLNSSSIKYHFGNKEGLLIAILKRHTDGALEKMERLIELDVSPEAKVRLHVSGIIRTHAKHRYLHRLMQQLVEQPGSHGAKELALEFTRSMVAVEATIIEQGVKKKIFDPLDPMLFYLTICGACDVIFYGRRSLDYLFRVNKLTPELVDKYIDYVSESLLRMLRK